MDRDEAQRVLEAVLLCAGRPLTLAELTALFDGALTASDVHAALLALQRAWEGRGLALACAAGGWRFQSRPQVHPFLERLHPDKPPRYSRAVLETLAVIAYRQPVTRGDIEAIRGVTVGTPILRQLEERGWIEVVGHRDTVGRPALYATTRQFLDDLGLPSLEALPALEPQADPTPELPGLEAAAETPNESPT